MQTPRQFSPPSGTRDFLASEVRLRQGAFEKVSRVFERFGFEPLQTPAFERLEILSGKYGDEGDKLIFKILRRGEWEASGESDLALRYDLTVPLARVVAAYGNRLGMPYKRYAIGPVWRADRPGKGRYREFTQCDLDQVGSASLMCDAETILGVYEALRALGISDFCFLLNSRRLLAGLLSAFDIPDRLGSGVLISLDKLDKLDRDRVVAELESRGLDRALANRLVASVSDDDAEERMRSLLQGTVEGIEGFREVDQLLDLVKDGIPSTHIRFAPRLMRGLSYYTGPIWEVVTPLMPGSIAAGGRYDHLIAQLGGPDAPATGGSMGLERIIPLLEAPQENQGRLDVAVVVVDEGLAVDCFQIVSDLRRSGLRSGIYAGQSAKLGRQMKWASEEGAQHVILYGGSEHAQGSATVRDMVTGEQVSVARKDLSGYLAEQLGSVSR